MTGDSPPHRRADLDALRVGAVYLLFLFHTLKVYDPRLGYHVWSPDLIPAVSPVTAFINIWHMPLLFFLAGWSAVMSLRTRGTPVFLRDRVRRLALPLIFGIALLCPLIKYVELRSGVWLGIGGRAATAALQQAHGALQAGPLPVAEPYLGSFPAFLPEFYGTLKFVTWSHLWFLAYLLLYTTLLAPLLVVIARGGPVRTRQAVLALCLPAAVLAFSEALLRPYWPGTQDLINDWANVARYGLYLMLGALWARYPGLGETMRARWPAALAAGIMLYTVAMAFTGGAEPASRAARFADHGARAASGWFFILFLLGLAGCYVTKAGAWLESASGTAMAVYILHQPVIVLAAYNLDTLALPVAARLAIILLVSVALTLALVHGVIARADILRAGFGLTAPPRAAWFAAGIAAFSVAAGVSLRFV